MTERMNEKVPMEVGWGEKSTYAWTKLSSKKKRKIQGKETTVEKKSNIQDKKTINIFSVV